jgi:hypothetical protein
MCSGESRSPTIVERFAFRGFHGRRAVCDLEIVPLRDGRTLVIATERANNPGTSITNVAEHLASHVCDRFGIEPDKLVWVEHYGYPRSGSQRERTYDLVTFERRPPEYIAWSPSVLSGHPDGWPGYFGEPEWRPMRPEDWQSLGVQPRQGW